MREFVRPRVVVSKCLEFDHCRYNGDMISSPIVAKLKEYVDFLPVCAEVEIGLGIPRSPVRIIIEDGEHRLVQPTSGKDVTEDMKAFCTNFLDSVGQVDGFILKFRSPSCGLKDVKVYPSVNKSGAVEKTSGYFGAEVLKRYPFLPIEDEGRLRNDRIKEHFMTKLFLFAAFRKVKAEGDMNSLVRFHTENKYLLMAYSQAELRKLGSIVANKEKRSFKELVSDYEEHLYSAFSRPPKYTSSINVLMHALGHFSDSLSTGEKALFFDWIQKYREGKTSLCPAINTIRSWVVRFEDQYLMHQTFFEPYPEGLLEVDPVNSQFREDLWK
ncbi:MAG: YbgA family protein [Methanosarcina sp.]|uniref:YbgA family protein n=1 Tax=Methanosarcina sp. TaxID=2213 RepID=UPI003BB72427